MKLIVGLGNPGTKYRHTRHNVGFEALNEIADKLGISFDKEKHRAQIAVGQWKSEKVMLLKPLTYMNLSGESVARAARNSINDPEDVLTLYDDVELPLGRIRIRKGGSPGTHNGMKSVVERLGTRDVPRLRMGVGSETRQGDLTDHVLGRFTPDEQDAVKQMVSRSADAVLLYIEDGIDAAMNNFNTK